MRTFYMCSSDKTPNCRVMHATYGKAKREAERIARKEDCGVSVLKVVAYVKPIAPPVEWEEGQDISTDIVEYGRITSRRLS